MTSIWGFGVAMLLRGHIVLLPGAVWAHGASKMATLDASLVSRPLQCFRTCFRQALVASHMRPLPHLGVLIFSLVRVRLTPGQPRLVNRTKKFMCFPSKLFEKDPRQLQSQKNQERVKKESRKSLPGPPAPQVQKVLKESQKSPKRVKNDLF